MKKMLCAVLVAAFTLSASAAFAAKSECTIDSIEGDKVTMTCKKADGFAAGETATLNTKKKKEIAGC